MKYLLSALLFLIWMTGSSQTITVFPGKVEIRRQVEQPDTGYISQKDYDMYFGHHPDSVWHIKGTHKKVTRHWPTGFTVDQKGFHVQYSYDTTDEAFARKLDTIDVWRAVADTLPGHVHSIKLMGVKEVREQYNEAEEVLDAGAYLGRVWRDYWQHLKYLTAGGHQLPKGMVVMEIEMEGSREPEYAVTPDPPPPPATSRILYLNNTYGSELPITVDTLGFNSGITVGGGIKWQPYTPPNMTLDPSWLPRRFRKRYERWLKKQHHETNVH